jgi:hypothetical protein
MKIDPQVQRRLLAASGFAELTLFQEAVQELEELPECSKELSAVLVVWLEVYQRWEKWSEAESVAMRLLQMEPEEPNWLLALAYATRRSRGLVFAQQILLQAGKKFELRNHSIQPGMLRGATRSTGRSAPASVPGD